MNVLRRNGEVHDKTQPPRPLARSGSSANFTSADCGQHLVRASILTVATLHCILKPLAGHAISKDMLRWTHLPIALYPDSSSCGGEWSGSATVNAPGSVTLSYSVQCNSYFGQAVPQNPADPFLVNWTANNVVGHKAPATGGFRDPSSAWKGPDGVWRQLLACGGASCLYNSTDFKTWTYAGHAFGNGKGPTWEMPDIFPLPDGTGSNSNSNSNGGEERAAAAAGVTAAAAASAGSAAVAATQTLFYKVGMENGTDYWTTGTFDYVANAFVPGDGVDSQGFSPLQQCDYGMFYSSKTFNNAVQKVLIGWVGEGPTSPLKVRLTFPNQYSTLYFLRSQQDTSQKIPLWVMF